jgi:hypothetical protein
MRTWSVGNLDLPTRPPPDPSSVMNRQEPLLRDKRRSVTGLIRRDSSGVSLFFFFFGGDLWAEYIYIYIRFWRRREIAGPLVIRVL